MEMPVTGDTFKDVNIDTSFLSSEDGHNPYRRGKFGNCSFTYNFPKLDYNNMKLLTISPVAA
jgi:hypothetical protein